MLKKSVATLTCVIFTIGCGSHSNTTPSESSSKELHALVEGSTLEIISDFAYPQNTAAMSKVAAAGLVPPGSNPGQISLIGNSNHFRIFNDSIQVYLPYFGERQMTSGYGQNDTSIQYSGIPDDYSMEWNEKKKRYDLQFSFTKKTENFRVNAQLFPNLKSSMTITSSFRFPIRYTGEIKSLSQ
ncbi:DUF4251 domain-containing protein [Eudoraea chungangensis]|uniref:DUF4251 domain-containing protein n=1 Tax=Eudoraea chungangensis TaxID=1481905 RepID=UPI0023EDAF82|nr:DUF4251 domain-containing protein [Eudoraea chungangensis]